MVNLEEIDKFEQENGVPYVDLFAQEDKDAIEGTNTALDGKTVDDYAKSKGICQAAADGVYGGIRSLVELATIPAYKATTKMMTGDWGNYEQDASQEFNKFLPPEVEPTTKGEAIVQGISKFATTTAIAGGVGKAAGLTGKGGAITNLTIKSISKSKDGLQVGKILAPALNGMIGDATAFWQDKENLSNIISQNTDNKYIKGIADWLAIQKDDDAADRALKQSLEGIFTNGAVNAIFKTLKGVKKYGVEAIKEASLSRKSVEFAKDIEKLTKAQRLMEIPETAEQIAKGVSEGTRIEPGISALQKEVQNMNITVPRNPEVISIEQARRNVAERLVDMGFGDADTLSSEQLSNLARLAENQIEKVLPALKSEENVFLGSLVKMKQAGKDFAEKQITKDARNQAFFDALSETAEAFGKTQDMLTESATAMGLSSKSEAHKTIKEVFEAIKNNADELTKDRLFETFSGAKTVEELRTKLKKLGYIDKSSFERTGARNLVTQITALEQAGLMSNFGTIARNIITSIEMGAENIISKPFAATVSAFKRGLFRDGNAVSGVEFKEAFEVLGGYMDAFKDAAEWFFDKNLRKTAASPWQAYRNSAPRQAMTNLPKEVGQTFKGNGPLSRFLEKYVQYSGVGVSEKIDNFFEAMFYRGEARARSYEYAVRVGREKGLSSEQVKELYKNTLDKVMAVDTTNRKNMASIVDGLMSDNLVEYSISKKAREGAAKSTFRGGRGVITEKIAKTMDTWWITRPLIPFFKTGSTIFLDRFVSDLTPLGIFSKQFRDAIKKGGREADEALGKMTLGGALLGYGYTLASQGKITGDYSSDPDVRNAQIAAGWQPNSLVFENDDGTKRYVSLDYMGPLSMALKYPAKLLSAVQDYKNSLKFYEDEKFLEKMSVVASAFVADAIDESSLRYFSDGMSFFRGGKPDELLSKAVGGVAKLPLRFIPRAIGEAAPIFNDTNQIRQMLDGIGDEVKKSFGVPTNDMYDVFGKPILDKSPIFSLFGIKTKEVPQEPWLEHLAEIGVGFEMPRTAININGVNLEITKTQANAINKEMGEIGAYEALKKTCSSKEFMKQPKELQKEIATKIFSGFRNAAIQRYYSKDADLQEDMASILKDLPKKYSVPSLGIGK